MQPFIAQICIFGFNFPPRDWTLCYGQLLAIAQYNAVFALVGTFYGGNGRTDFGVPDLRGRSPAGQGTGPGLTPLQIGQRAGVEYHTLTTSQMPAHDHTAVFTPSGGGSTADVQVSTTVSNTHPVPAAGDYIAAPSFGGGLNPTAVNTYVTNGSQGTTVSLGGVSGGGGGGGTVTVGSTGSGSPISMRNPFQTLNFSFALDGIFPSRN